MIYRGPILKLDRRQRLKRDTTCRRERGEGGGQGAESCDCQYSLECMVQEYLKKPILFVVIVGIDNITPPPTANIAIISCLNHKVLSPPPLVFM
jgi:hypothetical protein